MSGWRRGTLAAAFCTLLLSSCTSQIPAGTDTKASCRDHERSEYSRGEVYYRQFFNASGAALDSAADIVLVVDESGSIDMKVLWIREVVPELDDLLQSRGVGAGIRQNYFSLIGFGRDDPRELTGIVLSELAPQPTFLKALDKLQTSGVAEDGYAALDFAIKTTVTREGTVKQLILVTDEDRRVIRNDLDRGSIEKIVVESGYVLNVVVSQGFLANVSNDNSHALGLDSNRTAYVFDESSPSLYSTSPGGAVHFTPFTFFPNTYADYVDLAFSVGGAAWDINFVVEGKPLSLALARAFAEVKIAEVMSVLRICESCLCGEFGPECRKADGVTLQNCVGPAPDMRCFLAGGRVLDLGESAVLLTLPPTNQTRAADIILIVDESSSMVLEHDWIPDMTQQLDTALQEVNVGRGIPNRFGLVGFGGDCSDGFGLGRVLGGVGGQQFSFASNFTELSEGLTTSGRREDGYSGIHTALRSYQFREGVAKQFILVTDEDRDPVDANITRDLIETALLERDILLNVAVNEAYSGGALRALGIDSRGGGYVYDPSSETTYRLEGEGGAVRDSGHGGTHRDYTQLALDTGGGAWDLNTLRLGGTVAASFTAAFVHAKVDEIISQFKRCLNCACTPTGPVCVPQPASLCDDEPVTSSPPPESPLSLFLEPASDLLVATIGTDVSLTCTASTAAATMAWTFNGGHVPANSQLMLPGPGVTVLQLSAVQEENVGLYACLAHSLSGRYRDAIALELDIYNPEQDLELSLKPLDPSISPGQSLHLSCTVAAPAEFTWTFNDGPLPGNSAVTQESSVSSVLALRSVIPENAGAYTCRANNAFRGVINEDTSYLTITNGDASSTYGVTPPTAIIGERMVLSCDQPCFEGVYEWYQILDNGTHSEIVPDVIIDELVVSENVTSTAEVGGHLYKCCCPSASINSDCRLFKIGVKPVAHLTISNEVTKSDSAVNITCMAESYPPADKSTNYILNHALPLSIPINPQLLPGKNGVVYTVNAANKERDAGDYECTVTVTLDEYPTKVLQSDKQEVHLKVYDAPIIVSVHNSTIYLDPNVEQSAILECAINNTEDNLEVWVNWTAVDGKPVKEEHVSLQNSESDVFFLLLYTYNISNDDGHQYMCKLFSNYSSTIPEDQKIAIVTLLDCGQNNTGKTPDGGENSCTDSPLENCWTALTGIVFSAYVIVLGLVIVPAVVVIKYRRRIRSYILWIFTHNELKDEPKLSKQ